MKERERKKILLRRGRSVRESSFYLFLFFKDLFLHASKTHEDTLFSSSSS
jgi:hypothetical protein